MGVAFLLLCFSIYLSLVAFSTGGYLGRDLQAVGKQLLVVAKVGLGRECLLARLFISAWCC